MEMKVIDELAAFIQEVSGQRRGNRWIGDDTMSVYVRHSLRMVNYDLKETLDYKRFLDVANVEVGPEHQGKGFFRAFMTAAKELNPWDGIFIENTHNPIVEKWCQRHNWRPYRVAPYCYYKMKNDD